MFKPRHEQVTHTQSLPLPAKAALCSLPRAKSFGSTSGAHIICSLKAARPRREWSSQSGKVTPSPT